MTFKLEDLFYSRWEDLDPIKMSKVIFLLDKAKHSLQENLFIAFGYYIKSIIKEITLPGKYKVISQLNENQIVDVYNDLFIHKPWYFFPIKRFKATLLFVAPDEYLSDISFMQWSYADAEFSKICVLGDQKRFEDADKVMSVLVATIYKPYTGKRVAKFDRSMVEEYSKLISLKPFERLLILRTYLNIRSFIIQKFPNLFPANDSKDTKPSYTGELWQSMHFDLSETPAFQGFDKASEANIYDALAYLDKKAIEIRERKEKIGK